MKKFRYTSLLITFCLLISCSGNAIKRASLKNKNHVFTKTLTVEEKTIMALLDSITTGERNLPVEKLRNYLINFLQDKNSLSNNLDSLSNYERMDIIQSNDKKIRIISYDLCAMSYHSIESIAQYITNTGAIKVKMLNISKEEADYLDLSYYNIIESYLDGNKYYFAKGWGSYGEGTQFKVIRAFQIDGDTLKTAKIFEQDKGELTDCLIFETSRQKNSTISYDSIQKQFEYKEFEYKYFDYKDEVPSEDSVYIQSSEDSVYMQSSEDSVYMQSNEDSIYIQSSEDSIYMESGEDSVFMQLHGDRVFIQSREDSLYMQSSKDTVYIKYYWKNGKFSKL